MKYNCYICRKDISNTFRGLGNHFRRVHNLSLTKPCETEFICVQENCCRRYALFASLCRYLRKHHASYLLENSNTMCNNLDVPSTSSYIQTESDIPGIAETIKNTDTVLHLDDVSINGTQTECEISTIPENELANCLPVQTTSSFETSLTNLKDNIARQLLTFQAKNSVT